MSDTNTGAAMPPSCCAVGEQTMGATRNAGCLNVRCRLPYPTPSAHCGYRLNNCYNSNAKNARERLKRLAIPTDFTPKAFVTQPKLIPATRSNDLQTCRGECYHESILNQSNNKVDTKETQMMCKTGQNHHRKSKTQLTEW